MGLTPVQQSILDLSRAATSETVFNAPEGLAYLPYQNAGIDYGLKFPNVLIADEPGLGKTIQAIGIANERQAQGTFIVCEASLRETVWKRELEKWSKASDGNPRIRVLYKERDLIKERGVDFWIASYNFVAKRKNIGTKEKPEWSFPHLEKIRKRLNFEMLIIDESHNLKSTKAARTKAVYAVDGLRGKARWVVALTGTPIVNKPIEIYTTAKSLFPKAIKDKDYFGFGMRYCNGFKRKVSRYREAWDFSGASNLKELGTNLRLNGMVRRRKKDVLKDLPDKTRNLIFISPQSKQLFYEKFDKSVDLGNIPQIDFETASKQRRELGVDKALFAVDYISTQLDGGHEKIVVFGYHNDVLDILKEGLSKYGLVEIRGNTPPAGRLRAVDDFQGTKNTRVFLGNIKAAGVGLTLTKSSYVVIVEPAWEPGTNEQAEDRTHRVGQKNHVMIDYLLHENSMDARIVEAVLEKNENIKELLQ